ncbi:MAG: tetratricopeptide repeat protein [Bacteroidales bacterium]|jgi:tetratricopeptide (TPR) repeat protein|nr:tetratricopeptide repeat protein [Bacteroidales bacterium]
MNKENNKTENKNLAVGEVITKTEIFIERNKKLLSIIAIAIVLIVGGWLAYYNFVAIPKEKNAAADLFPIQHYFGTKDYDKVLNGDGKHMGAIAFIDTYGSGKSSNLAKYYAGVAYVNKKDFQKALDYLEDAKFNDLLLAPIAKMLIGDCYAELKQNDKAIKYYEQSATYDNDMTSPAALMKLGSLYQMNKEYEKALDAFKKIKQDYPRSMEYQEVEKYISQTEALLNK